MELILIPTNGGIMDPSPKLRHRLRRARGRGVFALFFGLLLGMIGAVGLTQPADASAAQQPPGANGSVKIGDGSVDDDPNPDNQPHVGCRFNVQFFGFDAGTNTAVVNFQAQPPSGSMTPVLPTTGRTTFTFQVPTPTPPGDTLNHTEVYELDTTGLEPNNEGEVHIKVDVLVTDDSGDEAFKKSKVFWTMQCPPVPSPSPTPPSPSPTPGPTEFPGGIDSAAGPGSAAGTGDAAAGPGSAPASDSAGGISPVGRFGWIALFAGLAVAAIVLVQLRRSVRRPTRDA